jgi:hypothetical protein
VQFEMVILLLQQSPDEHIITPFLEQTASPDESEVSQREHPNVMTILLGADQTSPFIYSAYPISTSDLGGSEYSVCFDISWYWKRVRKDGFVRRIRNSEHEFVPLVCATLVSPHSYTGTSKS